jgi:hypothetical protein
MAMVFSATFNNISVIWWSIFSFSGHLNIPSLINYMMVGLWSFLYYISTGCSRGRDRMVDVFTYSISVYQHYRCEFEFRSG